MASVNKVFLIGNLGVDPETRFLPSGKQTTEFKMATQQGPDAKVDWHTVVCWEKTAEIAAKWLSKGSPVHIEGRIAYRTWDKSDGTKGYTTEIICERLTLLSKKGDGEEAPPAVTPPAAKTKHAAKPADDELPF